jgi:hypothetical protein
VHAQAFRQAHQLDLPAYGYLSHGHNGYASALRTLRRHFVSKLLVVLSTLRPATAVKTVFRSARNSTRAGRPVRAKAFRQAHQSGPLYQSPSVYDSEHGKTFSGQAWMSLQRHFRLLHRHCTLEWFHFHRT